MARRREKLTTQVDFRVLAELRALAAREGRQLRALVDEALTGLLEKRKPSRPRPHVMAAYLGSHGRFRKLYQKLAR